MTDKIQSALSEVFTPEELAKMRRDVQYGVISFVTIVEKRKDNGMRYKQKRPTEPGWYWFKPCDDSPVGMTRFVDAIVYIGMNDTAIELWCSLSQGIFKVEEMGGFFAGPIPKPKSKESDGIRPTQSEKP